MLKNLHLFKVELVMALFNEIRLAARSLRRDPLFTVTILTIVTLGIGTTTAIFTVVDALVLRGRVTVGNVESLI